MHIITRLIIGGAQENTLLTVEDLRQDFGDDVLLVTGPAEGPEGDLFERVRRRSTPVVLIPELCRALAPTKDAIAYSRLVRLIKNWQPDIVHTHSSKAGVLGRAAAYRCGVPVVVHTVHGSPFHPYERPWKNLLFRSAERWAARRCHGLIAVSEAMKKLYTTHGIGKDRPFEVIYSGMEVEGFLCPRKPPEAVRRELGIPPDAIVIGKVARLFELKGHEYVIEAARRVVALDRRVRFLFVGDGILREELQRQIRTAGLTEYFVFAGLVPPAKVPDLIHAMDIVVHCSLREGLARVLAQARLARKPVVVFRLDGAWEVIEHGANGFLVEPENVEQLADYLCKLVADPILRVRMAEHEHMAVVRRFDHHEMTRQIRSFYLRLLDERSREAEHAPPVAGNPQRG